MDDRLVRIVARICQSQSLLLMTHARPDGDGLGAMAALAMTARKAGKRTALLAPDKLPDRYAFLFPDAPPAGASDFASLADAADLIVILDTCAFSQLDGLADQLRARRDKIVVLDHHATADDVGCIQWIDASAAAAGVLTAELIEALGWPIWGPSDENVKKGQTTNYLKKGGQTPFSKSEKGVSPLLDPATALATAITSDTGWLRFANTDSRCLACMGRLLTAGVRTDRLYARLYQCDRPERLRLMARMLGSLELHCDGRLAVMCVRKPDFAVTGALSEETENLVNEALRIGSVESSILLVENGGQVRVSLRSRDVIDVSAIAGGFGGGGHARASGIRSTLRIDELKARLIEAFIAEFHAKGIA